MRAPSPRLRPAPFLHTAFALATLWIALLPPGCGSSGGDDEADDGLHGEWRMVQTFSGIFCPVGLGSRTFTVALSQEDDRFTLRTPDGTFGGTRTDDMLAWAGEYWDSGLEHWIRIGNATALISEDGDRIEGSATFELREEKDGGLLCTGTVAFDLTRATPELPAAPANLSARPASTRSIGLSWSDRSDDEDGFRVYELVEGAEPVEVAEVAAGRMSVEIGGLEPGTGHRYHARAFNAAGESAPSNEASAVTDRPSPGLPPTGLEAQPLYRTSMRLTWIDQATDTTSFHVYRDRVLADVVRGDATSYFDPRLEAERSYDYQVSAVGPGGESARTPVVEGETLSDITGAWLLTVSGTFSSPCHVVSITDEPASLDRGVGPSALAIEAGSVGRLEGTLLTNDALRVGVELFDGFRIGAPNLLLAVSRDVRRMQGVGGATGVIPGQPVCYGQLDVLLERPGPPAAPQDLSATATGPEAVALAWTDASSTEEEFRIERRAGGGAWVTLAVLGAGARAYTDPTVEPERRYDYRVFARNASGESGASNVATVTTPPLGGPPDPPQGLAAEAQASDLVRLDWDAVADADRTRVYRGGASGALARIAQTSGFATSFVDSTVAPATTYRYEVTAENDRGESGPSNRVSVTTPAEAAVPAAPSGLQATAASTERIDLAWTDEADDETGFRLQVALPGLPFAPLETLGPDVEAFAVTGLTPDTRYSFRLLAFNDEGDSAYSNTAAATTLFEPECDDGRQACVPGAATVLDRCVEGRWTRLDCPAMHLCSQSVCRNACGYESVVAGESAICFAVNGDGVNDGVLFVTNDPEQLTPLAENGGPFTALTWDVQSTQSVFDGSVWPYSWTIRPGGAQYLRVQFQLAQLADPLRRIFFEFRGRSAGVHDDSSNYVVRAYAADLSELLSREEFASLLWQRRFVEKAPVTPYFSTGPGQWNVFSLTGRGRSGDDPDWLDINWVLLRVLPPGS